MPRTDGLELQCRLAAIQPLLPIIFFTAHGTAEEQARAMAAGAKAFLRKPVTAEVILKTLNDALGLPGE